MEDETLTAPPETGNGTETPPQETETPSGSQPQDTGVDKVESTNQPPQEPEPPRRKPSDFFRERQRIRKIEDTISTLAEKQAELLSFLRSEREKSGETGSGKFDVESFFKDPEPILSEREKRLLKEIEGVKAEIQGWKQEQTKTKVDQTRQEALELLFPKSSPDSKESLEIRVNADPERTERILELLKEPGVIQLFESNPERAAKFVLMEAGEPAKNPTIISKKLMGATRGGTAPGGAKTMNKDDLRKELGKIKDELGANPSLRGDEKFMRRRNQVVSDLEKLMMEEKRD